MNDLLTLGCNLRIGGHKLKIAGDHASNGIWFVNSDTQERTRVDNVDIVSNMPSELMIVISELVKGTYRIEVITQYSTSGSLLKEPKTAMFERTLTVQ